MQFSRRGYATGEVSECGEGANKTGRDFEGGLADLSCCRCASGQHAAVQQQQGHRCSCDAGSAAGAAQRTQQGRVPSARLRRGGCCRCCCAVARTTGHQFMEAQSTVMSSALPPWNTMSKASLAPSLQPTKRGNKPMLRSRSVQKHQTWDTIERGGPEPRFQVPSDGMAHRAVYCRHALTPGGQHAPHAPPFRRHTSHAGPHL